MGFFIKMVDWHKNGNPKKQAKQCIKSSFTASDQFGIPHFYPLFRKKYFQKPLLLLSMSLSYAKENR